MYIFVFFVVTGCATRLGRRLPTSSTGLPYNDRMPTRTPVEQFGIGQQHVQNIGKSIASVYLHKLNIFGVFVYVCRL